MGNVLLFPLKNSSGDENKAEPPKASAEPGIANILIFTGVRYSHTPPPEKPPVTKVRK